MESDCQESHFRSTQHSFLQPGPPLFDYFVFAIDTWQVFFCTALFCIISNSSFTPTVYTDRDKSPHLCSRPFQYYGTIQAPQNVSCTAPCSSLSPWHKQIHGHQISEFSSVASLLIGVLYLACGVERLIKDEYTTLVSQDRPLRFVACGFGLRD